MARQRQETQRASPRLYLVTPLHAEPAALASALATIDAAAVLVRLDNADEPTLLGRVKALAPIVQDHGVALLLDGHPHLVARVDADGAHLTGIDALKAALGILKPGHIAGAGGLMTRHESMLAGEAGADYVMFGEPDGAGRRPAFEAVRERVAWWAEVFEPPSVGWAASLDEVGALAAAGADFVAVGDLVWAGPDRPAAMASAVAERLSSPEPVR